MATDPSKALYDELSYYTLAHQDATFIHQHIVDAYAAQTANAATKPISIIFALAGLYLFVEKKFTGRQVQQIHMQMAKHKINWPLIVLPAGRANITVSEVLAAAPGQHRDAMIGKWCIAVWEAYKDKRETIIDLLRATNCKI